jgi:hypothetical protein
LRELRQGTEYRAYLAMTNYGTDEDYKQFSIFLLFFSFKLSAFFSFFFPFNYIFIFRPSSAFFHFSTCTPVFSFTVGLGIFRKFNLTTRRWLPSVCGSVYYWLVSNKYIYICVCTTNMYIYEESFWRDIYRDILICGQYPYHGYPEQGIVKRYGVT